MNLHRQTQTITIADKVFHPADFATSLVNTDLTPYEQELFSFLREWYSDAPVVRVHTSGSTGSRKEIIVDKMRMMQSARLTCKFLGLMQGDSALLCMPLDYIGGKMVVVRALVAGLNLHVVTPCANPLAHLSAPMTFAAMVPMQVFNSLSHETTKNRLMEIKNLIIGGAAIDHEMALALKKFPNKVYSTYGMTETLSHIALRQLNGQDVHDRYYPFDSVHLSLAEPDGTLVIDAPLVAQEPVFTNDVAKIFEDGSFKILGRKDNMINSGGLKIQAEEVETLLETVINGKFAITAVPDHQYGEIVVLVTEQEVDQEQINKILPRYFKPKKILKIDNIPLTETNKIQRKVLKKLAMDLLKK